jgi:hypothetical protein
MAVKTRDALLCTLRLLIDFTGCGSCPPNSFHAVGPGTAGAMDQAGAWPGLSDGLRGGAGRHDAETQAEYERGLEPVPGGFAGTCLGEARALARGGTGAPRARIADAGASQRRIVTLRGPA